MQLTIGELSAIMGGVFALTTTIIGILVKMLFNTYQEKAAKEMELLQHEIKSIKEAREVCLRNHDKQQSKLSESMEKINDAWLNFVREDAAMEATRGRKVDALFNVVDNMKEKLHQIPEVINKKIEDTYRGAKNELQSELSDYIRTLLKNSSKKQEI